ncbi:MAG: hypothetical protein NTZ05_21760 [Chloroflexi bacterium]|nr:hypothetical protein [Chloroflexota bacterium]
MDQGGPAAVAAPVTASGAVTVVTATGASGVYRLALPLPASGAATYALAAGSQDTGRGQATVTVGADGRVFCSPAAPGSSCPTPGAGPTFHLPVSGIRVLATGPGGAPLNPPLPLRVVVRSAAGTSAQAAAGDSRGLLLPLADGAYDLEIALPGVLNTRRTSVAAPGAVTIETPPTMTITGTVTDGAVGAEGAAVVIENTDDPRLSATVTTCIPEITPSCVTGQFAVRVAANTRHRVTAGKAGYLAAAPVEIAAGATGPPAVTLPLSGLTEASLTEASAFAGQITGAPDGLPVTVTATLTDGRSLSTAAGVSAVPCTAEATGYCLRLPLGEWRLSARADGYATAEPGASLTIPPSGPPPAGPLLTLAATGRAATVAGSAIFGDPAAGGRVGDSATGATVEAPPGAMLDAEGPVNVMARLVGDAPGAGSLRLLDGMALQVDLRDAAGRRLTSFARPLAITLPYGPTIDAGRLSPADAARLRCARYDTAAGLWTPLSGVNDTVARTLTCFTDRLTKVALLTDAPAPVAPTPTVVSAPSGGGGGGGGGGNAATPTPAPIAAATPTPAPTRSDTTFAADHGGGLSVQNVALEAPAGVVGGSAKLSASLVLLDPSPGAGLRLLNENSSVRQTPEGTLFGATAFRLDLADERGSAVSSLARPVALSVGYGDEDVRRSGGDAQRLALLTDLPAPALLGPPLGAVSVDMAPSLRWTPPPGTRRHQVQVIPAGNDGPGVNLIIGDPGQVMAGRLDVPPPRMGVGGYILLPGMGYTWRVRSSPAPWALGAGDAGWSRWTEGRFRTGSASSAGIAPVSPAPGVAAVARTPVLRWRNANERLFYYEVQVSRDPAFQTDPALATAAVYWNLVHGGVTDPLLSWTVPRDAPLDAGAVYYWRVRPRVQGDGTPVDWGAAWTFQTEAAP